MLADRMILREQQLSGSYDTHDTHDTNADTHGAGAAQPDAAHRLGALIREHRHAAGLTQTELARRAGTSQPTVARLETGTSEPTVATLRRIASALGVDLVIEFHPIPDRA